MAFIDDMRAIASNARAIRGQMGIQTHRVWLVRKTWSGGEVGIGTETVTETEILEADNRSPNCKWLKPEEIAIGGLPKGTLQFGPITPPYPGGGTDPALFSNATLPNGATLYLKVVGERHPAPGALYVVDQIINGKAFSYSVIALPVAGA